MEFDNAQFEQGVSQSLQTLTRLDAALNDLENTGGFAGLSKTISSIGTDIEDTFSFRGVAALTTFQRIAESVINKVVGLFSGLKNNYMPVDFIDQAITGGQRRATNIENAKFRLEGLGVAYKDVANDIDHAVKDTAYGLDSAAKAASIMVAQGMEYGTTIENGTKKVSALGKALRGISGVAAMTNSSYDEIADIFEKIGSRNKVQAREANMLTSRALPLYATLTKYFNGVIDGSIEASDSVTKSIMNITKGMHVVQDDFTDFSKDGVITADIFFEAMDTMFGEHATEANKTYAGSLDNVKAALSRLGAVYYQGHMDNMIEVFNSLRLSINKIKEALTPTIERFVYLERKLTHGFSKILDATRDGMGDALYNLMITVRKTIATITKEFHKFFPEINIDKITEKINSLNEKLKNFSFSPAAWETFKGVLDVVFSALSLVKSAIEDIAYILEPWLGTLNVIAGDLLVIFGDAGSKIGEFNDKLENSTGVRKFVELLRLASETVAGFVSEAFNKLTLIIINLETIIRVGLLAATLVFLDISTRLSTKIEELKTKFEPIINAFNLATLAVLGFASVLGQSLYSLGGSLLTFIGYIVDGFSEGGIKGAFSALLDVFDLLPAALKNDFKPLTDFVHTYIDPFVANVKLYLTNLWLFAVDYLKHTGELIYESLPVPLQNALTKIQELVSIITGCFSTLFGSIGSFITHIATGFSTGGLLGGFRAFLDVVDLFPGAIRNAFAPLTTIIDEAVANAKARFDEFVEEFKQNKVVKAVTDFVGEIRTAFDEFAENISFETLGKRITDFFTDISDAISEFGNTITDGSLLQGIKGLFDLVVGYISSTAIGQFVSAMWDAGKSAVEGLVQGFMDGSALSALWGAISALVGSKEGGGILGFFANLVGWHSPWQIMIIAGAAALLGLAIGFRDSAGMKAITGALTDLKNKIVKFFEPIVTEVTKIGNQIRTKISDIYEPIRPQVEEAVNWIKENVTFSNIIKGIGTLAAAIGELGTTIANFVSGIIERIGKKFTDAKNAVTGFFGSLDFKFDINNLIPNYDELKAGNTALGKVLKWFESIGATVKGIAGWVAKALGGDYGEAIQQALGVTMLVAIPSAIYIIGGLVNKANALMGTMIGKLNALHRGAVGILNFFNGFGKAIQLQMSVGSIAKVFTSLALLVGAIAASIYSIAKLEPGQIEIAEKWFNKIAAFIISITLLMGALTAGLAKLSDNKIDTVFTKGKTQISKTLNAMGDVALAILAMGASVYLLVKSMESVVEAINSSNITPKQFIAVFGTIAGFVVALGIGVGIIAGIQTAGVAFVNQSDKLTPIKPKLFAAALTILAIGLSVKMLVDAFTDLIGICDAVLNGKEFVNGKETIEQATTVLLAICSGIMLMSAAGAIVGLKGGLGLLAVMASILLLKQVFTTLQDPAFTYVAILDNCEHIIVALGLIAAIMFTTRFAGENAAKGGLAILLVTGSVILIMKAFAKMAKALDEVDGWAVTKAIFGVLAIMGGIAALIRATNKCATSFKSAAVILALSSLVVTLTIMMGAMTLCAHLSPGPFLLAGVVFGAMLGMAAVLVKATGVLRKTNVKALTGIGFILASIGVSLFALSFIPWENLKHSLIAMGVMMGAVAGIMLIMGAFKVVNFGPLVAATVMLGVVAIALGALSALCDPKALVDTAEGLTKVMLALAGTLAVCTIVGAFAGAAWVGILTLVGFIAIFSMMLWALGDLVADSESVLKGQQVLVSLGHTIGAFIGAITAGFEEASASALPQVGEYLSQFSENASGFFEMIEGTDFENLTSGIKNLISALGQITTNRVWEGIVTSLSNSGNSSMTLFSQNLVAFGTALNAFSVAITANGGIDKNAVDSAVEAGNMLVVLEKQITPFGNITNFFSTRTFSDFGVSIQDYADGLKKLFAVFTEDIKKEDIDTAISATDQLVKLEGQLPKIGGLVSLFTGNTLKLGDFGTNLGDFGEGLSTFFESIKGIDTSNVDAVLNATTTLIGLSGVISDNNLGKRGWEWLGGNNKFEDFGRNLGDFADQIIQLNSKFTQLTNVDVFTTVASNIDKLVTAVSKASAIDATKVSAFASSLGQMSSFVNGFSVIDESVLTSISTFITSFTTELTTNATAFEAPGKDSATSFRTGFEAQAKIVAQPAANTLITEFVTGIRNVIAAGDMERAAVDAIAGFETGIKQEVDSGRVSQLGASVGTNFLNGFDEATGHNSPWTTMIVAGRDGIQGLINGLNDSGMRAQLRTAAESLGGDKSSGTGVLGWFASAVGWRSPWWQMTIAGKDGVQGLINGIKDPTARRVLQMAAKTLGTDTVDEIVKNLDGATAGQAVVKIGRKLGLNFTYSVKDGVKFGGLDVEKAANQIISMLEGKAKVGQGIFNFLGSQADVMGEYPEYVQQQFNNYQTQLQNLQEQEEETGNETNNLGGSLGGAGSAASGAAKSAKEAAEEAKRHEKAVRLQNEAAEEFVRVYGMCFDSLEDTTGATEIAKTAIEDLARTFGLTEDQVADTEAEIEELFMSMYDTIHGSVDGSMKLFERFSSEMSVAPEVMLRNMRSNFTGIEEWSEEIQMLAAKGFSRGLVEELAKEGPASQAKVRTFLKMTFGQMMEANDLYSKKTDATAKATVKAITAMAFAGKSQEELIRLANDGSNSIQSNAAKASLEAANHAQKVLVTYRELRDTISETIESQMDLFSEFDMKTETSADKMLANMASQITGVQDWANGLQVLAERGIDDGLLLKLKELGPKGYDQVNAFVQMTAEQLEQANGYYQQSLILPQQVATQVSTSYLNTGLSVAQSMISGVAQGAVQNQEQLHTGLQQAAQGALESVKTDIQSNVIDVDGVGLAMDTEVANSEIENTQTTVVPASEQVVAEGAAAAEEVATDAMANAGYNMVAGMVNAMLSDEALTSVRSAAVSLAMAANTSFQQAEDEHSPSRVWNGFGRFLVMGLANGLYENADLASIAATELATNANTALQQALNQINADGLDNGLQPTITPVLDLTDIQNGMGVMNGLLNSQTYAVNGIANIDPASMMNQSFAMLNDAINRLSMMQSQPSVGDINVTVNAQGIDDPNLLADVVAQRIYTEILSREAVVY